MGKKRQRREEEEVAEKEVAGARDTGGR